MADRAEIGVIGGSGLYALLDDPRPVQVDTPYGSPSDEIVLGEVGGRLVAFLPRHGSDHRFPPHRIPYRANVWALASLVCGRSSRRVPSAACRPTPDPAPW